MENCISLDADLPQTFDKDAFDSKIHRVMPHFLNYFPN